MRELCFLALLCAVAGVARAAPERPDIVFILADDLGRADVGFHGSEIKTPHLDRLAAAGARLDAFYTLPVCTPSRCAFMTGRYPIRYGRQFNVLRPGSRVGLSLDERLLPQALHAAGYATVQLGKWHLGDFDPAYLPLARGFDHSYGYRAADHKRLGHLLAGGDDLERDGNPCQDEGWVTDLVTDEAVRRIENRDPGKPLFLYVAYHAPHSPFECPPAYAQPYEHLGPGRDAYAGMIAQMDAGIGRIVAAVERQGRRAGTLFIFASDNGGLTAKRAFAKNVPFRDGKGSLYEGGVRVVAFATWDGHIPAGTVVKEPLHMVDWYPTLVRLAGGTLDQPLPLDGRDAWPTITAGGPSPHEVILMNFVSPEGALRMGDWKLVRARVSEEAGDDAEDDEAAEGGEGAAVKGRRAKRSAAVSDELFNLARDPSETTNVAAAEPDTLRELGRRLDAFAREAVPPILKPVGERGAGAENGKRRGTRRPDGT